MVGRKPQINFQVDPPLKSLYDEAKIAGYRVSRLCAAGLLLMVENRRVRERALDRLRDWESEYAAATAADVRDFVRGARAALAPGARDTRPAPKARSGRRKAALGRSA